MVENIKAIFHTHTTASHDAAIYPEELIKYCIQNNINAVAVTDHNTFQNAKKLTTEIRVKIIPGEEIQTREGGEIIGLFLKEEIAKELPALEVIQKIRAQDGVVYLPHPFDTVRRRQFSPLFLETLAPQIDIVETFNARNIFNKANLDATAFAQKYKLLSCVGSDAHILSELKNSSVTLPIFSSASGLKQSLLSAEFNFRRGSFFAHFASAWLKIRQASL
jgi:hypothetical protein